ncbi:hypothetical protein E2C01_023443 [Portunus trituberculatus]|uniref:Uncharacterized protein n=1 Tax=Portunus trituberculatus TaxID=210409 RepID=A0A5B7EB56_PORTR|nr:hypothetical protein [Portunus trituberculatus]
MWHIRTGDVATSPKAGLSLEKGYHESANRLTSHLFARWKERLTLPHLTVYKQIKEFVYRINRYFLKEKACKDHFYPQIRMNGFKLLHLVTG